MKFIQNNKLATSVRSVVPSKQHCYRQWFKEGDKLVPNNKRMFMNRIICPDKITNILFPIW